MGRDGTYFWSSLGALVVTLARENNEIINDQYQSVDNFYILLAIEVPSLPCFLFVIVYIVSKRTLHVALSNYALPVLLFPGFIVIAIDISLLLHFYYPGTILAQNAIFCKTW